MPWGTVMVAPFANCGGLAYVAHVVDMRVDEFAERFQARYRFWVAQRRASSRRRKVPLT
ncbi:msl0567 [Mesorhizobium japonicum MAFF 303099]|uniref:Msl0567 protein n=1 Tax=Mesorhizobium japonicum (strain LMG 29417 / CECT 9101 / MAFF 303099) TaxID=266835 RepID=Q98MI4_RHILO|nr:msl0567 [Mesorhizobium japonicum MAFF 303099]